MKSRDFKIVILTPFVFLLFAFGGNLRYPGGSPAGYTGSPGDGKDCTFCHGGTSSEVDNWITSDIPETGYIPGNTYNLSVSVSGIGDKGFLVSPQNPDGEQLGELSAGMQTELVGGTKYITQSNASSANPKIWNFQWIAPENGTGEVVFYGAFTVSEPVTKLSTLSVIEDPGVGTAENAFKKLSVYPNPASAYFKISMRENMRYSYELKDLQGKTIKSQKNIPAGGYHQFSIPGNTPSGIYLLKVYTKDEQAVRKLMIN